MLFIPYNKTWHSLDCCRLNGRDIIAYKLHVMILRFTVLFVLLIINETVYVVVVVVGSQPAEA